MTDSQKEKREALIKRHKEKMERTTVEERKMSEKRVLQFFSKYKDVDFLERKKEAVLSR